MKHVMIVGLSVVAVLLIAGMAQAGLFVVVGELPGTSDWLADVRLRNFNSTLSDYEMMVNASPTRTPGQNQVNGQVPGPYAFADWATNNAITITYDPLANSGAGWVSLRLVGTGARNNNTGPYDVTIGRAPDAVTAGPVNYINLQLYDRVNFPTFVNGLTISALDGQNLGNFTIPAAGIGSWSIVDPGGLTLNNGFILQGGFTLDLTKLAEGREGDKIIFGIGNNAEATRLGIPEPATIIVWSLLGLAGAGLGRWRRKRAV